MFTHIAVLYEEHPASERAFRQALGLASAFNTPVTILTLPAPLPAYAAYSVAADSSALQTLKQDQQNFYQQLTARLQSEANTANVTLSIQMLQDDNAEAVAELTTNLNIDLLIAGLHRHTLRISGLYGIVYSLSQTLSCNILGVH